MTPVESNALVTSMPNAETLTESDTPVVSHLKLADVLSMVMQFRGKAEAEWYRVIYLHAGLIGAMIFFAGESDLFATGRMSVFAFYTVNMAVSYAALKEAYEGLKIATQDVGAFPACPAGGGLQAWLATRVYRYDLAVRTGLMALVWVMVGGLMLAPLVFNRAIFP